MTWRRLAAGYYCMLSGFPCEWNIERGHDGMWIVWECFAYKDPVRLRAYRTKREAQRYVEQRAGDWGHA